MKFRRLSNGRPRLIILFALVLSPLVIQACHGPTGLVGPPYNVTLSDLKSFQKKYRVTKRHPNGTPRRILIRRTFKFRTLSFDKRDEWLWTSDGRPDYMLPSGITMIQGVPCKEHQYIYFHVNGNLKKCMIGWETWKHGPFVGEEKMSAEFHANGKLKKLGLREPYRKNGKTYWSIVFDETGKFLPEKSFHMELKKVN